MLARTLRALLAAMLLSAMPISPALTGTIAEVSSARADNRQSAAIGGSVLNLSNATGDAGCEIDCHTNQELRCCGMSCHACLVAVTPN
jgi:hypothetical protein